MAAAKRRLAMRLLGLVTCESWSGMPPRPAPAEEDLATPKGTIAAEARRGP